MACFLVSAAEAVVVTVAEKAQKKSEEKYLIFHFQLTLLLDSLGRQRKILRIH